MTAGVVAAAWATATHGFSKSACAELRLVEGQGVAGDAIGVRLSAPRFEKLERV